MNEHDRPTTLRERYDAFELPFITDTLERFFYFMASEIQGVSDERIDDMVETVKQIDACLQEGVALEEITDLEGDMVALAQIFYDICAEYRANG